MTRIVSADQRSFASAVNSLVGRLPNSVSTVVGVVLMDAGRFNIPIFLVAASFYVVRGDLFCTVFQDLKPTT